MDNLSAFNPYWLVIFSLLFAIVPVLIGVCTSYLKISVVLGMLKSGLGTQHTPSNLIVMSLSIALSIFVMAPVIEESINAIDASEGVSLNNPPELKSIDKFQPIIKPWKTFMQTHAGEREVATFLDIEKELSAKKNKTDDAKTEQEVKELDLRILIPAFLLTEIKEAFAMGFLLLLPFLVIDLIVANVLAGMGMYMLSPVMISLPLKLLFFVLSDGWLLLCKSLVMSYNI